MLRTAQRPAPATATAVPQLFTHKLSAREVLLAHWRRTGPDSFAVTARWPRAHGFYRTRNGLHDPLLFTETIRQMFPMLSHAAYRVPVGHHLLWKDFTSDLRPEALRDTGSDAGLTLHVTCCDIAYRKERAAAMTMRIEAVRDGVALGTARSRFTIQDPAVYRRLRGVRHDAAHAMARALPLPPPAPAHRVGRDRYEDVVLSPTDTADRWQLRVDTAHPILFDHPVDHAPGMLLLEAARQAAQAAAHPRPVTAVAMDCDFARYVELDRPCWVETAPLPDSAQGQRRVRVTLRQDEEAVFGSTVTLA
ncbi:ScbA/BarX family gamma-butyrolactone biosynthesis protein [Streptomyces sp. CT34]|uniref:ScbA/BarX family gamma-butyrolactone biosynthesis protein n=1 Tax=Streptomyces sp. CT34 TaxID=1553907 RepID=UPI0005B76AA0|nr:ScbA/BarX family gamma-butyrolactone biosynthesis protein [Streptomyces sp. CT34]